MNDEYNTVLSRRDLLKRTGAATSISALLSGCSEQSTEDSEQNSTASDSYSERVVAEDVEAEASELRVVYDEKGEMVCYIHRDGSNAASTGGMDCEPIEETAYNESDFE